MLAVITGVFNTRFISRSSATTLLAVWLCSLVVFIYFAMEAAGNFKTHASFSETIKLKPSADNVYHLSLNDIKYLTHDDSIRLNINDKFHNIIIKNNDDDDPEPRNVSINIIQSDTNQPELVEEIGAQGPDYETALLNARNTTYLFTQKDSVLQFDSKLTRKKDDLWHAEVIDITLKLPLNAKVIIDQELQDHVTLDDINVNDCKDENKLEKATSAIFVMTNDGAQCKVDTVVAATTIKQQDSARKAKDAETIAKYRAAIDSVKRADSLNSK